MNAAPVSDGLDTRIMELMISRLCHDLVSPVGAINNGVELIEEMGSEMGDEAMALIAQSGRSAAARLKAYRLAYGAAGGQADIEAVRVAAGDYFADTKIALDWPSGVTGATNGEDLPDGWPKAAINMVLLAEEMLGYGGDLRVQAAGGPAPCLTVTASGRDAGLESAALDALAGRAGAEALTPRTVQAFAAAHFAGRAGLSLTPGGMPGESVLTLAVKAS
ncbi:MAG: histidine phosphotransferase family protein [Azospirillaceae bacterium]